MTDTRIATFRLPGDLDDRVDVYARQHDSDRSALIRESSSRSQTAASCPRWAEGAARDRPGEDELIARAAEAVAAALGSERKLNAAVIEGLNARLDA